MKLKFTLVFVFLGLSIWSYSQVVIAGWSFPSGAVTDSIPNLGLSMNNTMGISAHGGTSSIDFSKNGATTKAAQASGWDAGNGKKYWQIRVKTTGYNSITLSSAITSGGNPGPRDFKVQYKVGSAGTWTDVPNSSFTTANDWTTGVLNRLALPSECNNLDLLYIRWIMASNTSSAGSDVASTGISKIDDISVYGAVVTGVDEDMANNQVNVFYNTSDKSIHVVSTEGIKRIQGYNIAGVLLFNLTEANEKNIGIYSANLNNGIYVVRIETLTGVISKKLLVRN